VDGTGSRSCPVPGSGISRVEPPGSAAIFLHETRCYSNQGVYLLFGVPDGIVKGALYLHCALKGGLLEDAFCLNVFNCA
jgi:hypothetical protein